MEVEASGMDKTSILFIIIILKKDEFQIISLFLQVNIRTHLHIRNEDKSENNLHVRWMHKVDSA